MSVDSQALKELWDRGTCQPWEKEYIRKDGGDIRAFSIGGETVAAIRRRSEHWITNTARGATTEKYPLTDALCQLCARVSSAVGGGLLAIDLFETDRGLLVSEVNATMEFREVQLDAALSPHNFGGESYEVEATWLLPPGRSETDLFVELAP